ncbi:MAG: FecR domain-containing protein, partial [Bacteroidetes bacterium]|nr:FecR domain-containing protein [Bacteroidota bacterium]
MDYSGYIQLLLKKLEQGACTPEEASFLSDWLADHDNQEAVIPLLAARMEQPVQADAVDDYYKTRLETLRTNILAGAEPAAAAPVHRVHFLRRTWWVAAAVLAGAIATILLVNHKPAEEKTLAGIHYKSDAAPGRSGALLSMADGSTIVLDSAAIGSITNHQGADIAKTGEERLAWHEGRQAPNAPLTYNKLATPRGRKFSMLLPDGTVVWLNAQSSVTFPSAFTAKERRVEVTGEIYFEVAQDKRRPFIVKAGAQTIQVLGTSFNVNTYKDEQAITTTLLEGSI